MKIGVVSDTHGHLELTRPAVRMLEQFDVEAVLHCGDIGTPDVIRQFARWPTHFVFGNCDYDFAALREAIVAEGHTCHDLLGQIELGGARIALLHSHDRRAFRDAIESGDHHLVCYGHTHVAAVDRHSNRQGGTTLVLNPGAVYRASPHSVAIVEITPGEPPSLTPPTIAAEIVPL